MHTDADSSVEINGWEEQAVTSWENHSKEDLQLDPLSKVTKYETDISTRETARDREDIGNKDAIVKTFQVSQYSS